MRRFIESVFGKPDGITAIECGLIAALLVVAAMGAVRSFGGDGEDRHSAKIVVQE